jgi:hypothetical protein
MARLNLGLLKSTLPQQKIEAEWKTPVPTPQLRPSYSMYPEQQAVFIAENRKPTAKRSEIQVVGRMSGAVDSGVSVAGIGAVGVGGGGFSFALPDTRFPDVAGSPALAIVTAVSASADTWHFTYTVPYDATQTVIYRQIRYMAGATALSDENFVASGTLFGDCAMDVESNGGWLTSPPRYGFSMDEVLFLTAFPVVTGDCQFGVQYKNSLLGSVAYGNLGSVATANATF